MVLYEHGIPAIAPCSENLFVSDSQYDRLKKKYKRIYLFYDNDEPGIKAMCKIKKQHNDLRVLFFFFFFSYKGINDCIKGY